MKVEAKPGSARYQAREVGKPIALDAQLGVVRFSPCGKYLAAGDFEGRVRRWDASAAVLTALPELLGHNGWVQALAFHPDGKLLFSGDSWGRLCCWAFADKGTKPAWTVAKAHDGWIRKVTISGDGKTVASCGSDGKVRLWSPDKGDKVQEWTHGLDVLSLTFAPDGKSILFGDLKGGIQRLDAATGKKVQTYDVKAMYRFDRLQDVGGVRCLAFDATGKTLAAGGCQPTSGAFVQGAPLLVFFEAATGKIVQSLKAGADSDGYVFDAHWHKDGFLMAVTSGQPRQGKMLFHRPGEAQPFFTTAKMANCHSLAVHPDGTRLLVSATNANSNGNGRRLSKDKKYPGNSSPLFVWDVTPS